MANEKTDVSIISDKRKRANPLLADMAADKGFVRPIKTKNVRSTTMWAAILFDFRNKGYNAVITTPKKAGMRAVTEGVSDAT